MLWRELDVFLSCIVHDSASFEHSYCIYYHILSFSYDFSSISQTILQMRAKVYYQKITIFSFEKSPKIEKFPHFRHLVYGRMYSLQNNEHNSLSFIKKWQ